MEIKLIEVRDNMTTMPTLFFRMDVSNASENWLMRRSGYYGPEHQNLVVSLPMNDLVRGEVGAVVGSRNQPRTASRTNKVAHTYMEENWDQFPSGSVLDVAYLLGERLQPVPSEGPGLEPVLLHGGKPADEKAWKVPTRLNRMLGHALTDIMQESTPVGLRAAWHSQRKEFVYLLCITVPMELPATLDGLLSGELGMQQPVVATEIPLAVWYTRQQWEREMQYLEVGEDVSVVEFPHKER